MGMQIRKFWLGLLILLSGANVLAHPTPLAAQGTPQTLEPFVAVEGQLNNTHLTEKWQFAGVAGQSISLVTRGITGNVNTSLTLLASDGSIVAQNDDSTFTNLDARLENVMLPQDDTYTVIVSRDGMELGATRGRYTLMLLEGRGSIFEGVYPNSNRQWLNQANLSADFTLPGLPEGDFYMQVKLRVQGETYRAQWILRDDIVFEWGGDGIWQVGLQDSAGGSIRYQAQGISEILQPATLDGVLAFTLVGNRLQVDFDRTQIVDIELPALRPGDSSALHFTLTENPQGTPSFELGDMAVTRFFYPPDSEFVAIPYIDPADRLFKLDDLPAVVVDELVARGVLENKAGVLQAQIAEGFIFTDDIGFSAYPLDQNPYLNTVLSFTGALLEGNEDTACGIIFRQEDGSNFSTVMFTPLQDLYFLTYVDGEPTPDSLVMRTPFVQGGLRADNQFTLVINDDKAVLYLNGRLMGTVGVPQGEGRLHVQIVLNEKVQSYCFIKNLWIWKLPNAEANVEESDED